MPRLLYPGVYLEETEAQVSPIPGVSTSIDRPALQSISAEFRRAVKTHAPEWTDHGEADPGVTLLELFAFLGENLLFHANEIPERGRVSARRAAVALAALGHASEPGCEGLERPAYFSGRLLDAGTLAAEQNYHRKKLRRHNRALHGYGVVTGLAVRVESTDSGESRIVVEPGYAIDPSGEEICVPRAVTLTPQGLGDSAVVTLRFWERALPSCADGRRRSLRGMPSVVEEACVIGISPAVVAPAFPLARLLSSEGRWRVDPLFVTPRVGTTGS